MSSVGAMPDARLKPILPFEQVAQQHQQGDLCSRMQRQNDPSFWSAEVQELLPEQRPKAPQQLHHHHQAETQAVRLPIHQQLQGAADAQAQSQTFMPQKLHLIELAAVEASKGRDALQSAAAHTPQEPSRDLQKCMSLDGGILIADSSLELQQQKHQSRQRRRLNRRGYPPPLSPAKRQPDDGSAGPYRRRQHSCDSRSCTGSPTATRGRAPAGSLRAPSLPVPTAASAAPAKAT
ncbi:hypothetical protein cyc_01183 [Cyclospora cayetanensis]|uniref:Uncharacterized protein n=1 Tax=Cyclospora cayetanensis TaxID=88456 RepID=A0A1D3CUJ4_9EIME|nr:hypothetical protein cyc_01183 [Cyclospora cayetanensis]